MLTKLTRDFVIIVVSMSLSVSLPPLVFQNDSFVNALPLDGTTEVFVSPNSTIAGFNESFYLWVNCTPGQPVNSFEFEMNFNPNVLQAVAVTEGDIFNGFSTMFNSGTINNNAGSIVDIYNLILGVGNVTGNGSFVRVEFETSDSFGGSSISLSDVGVTNESDYVNISTSNGFVFVSGDPFVSEQDYNYTIWDNQDGTFTFKTGEAGTPINYYNETGWHPINRTIRVLPEEHIGYNYNYRYYNPDGVFEAYFKNSSDKNFPVGFLYDKDEDDNTSYYLRTKLAYAGYMEPNNYSWAGLFDVNDRDIIVDDDTARYENIFPTGIDVNYSYTNYGLKEDIICPPTTLNGLLNNPPSDYGYDNDTAFFVFVTELDMGAVTAYDNGTVEIDGNYTMDDGRIVFKNISGDIKYTMPLDYVYEQNNRINRTKLRFKLVNVNDTDYLVVGVRYRRLINMTFPVVFDPTVGYKDLTGRNGILYYESGGLHIWDDCRAGTGGSGPTVVSTAVGGGGWDNGPTPYRCYRGYVFFDTGGLDDGIGDDITEVKLNFTTAICYDNDYLDLHVLSDDGGWVFPGSSLDTTDYPPAYYTALLGTLEDVTSSTGYNMTLDVATPTIVVNLQGTTSYCIREDWNDYLGADPNGGGTYDNYFHIEAEDDITLWITYSQNEASTLSGEGPANGSTGVSLNPTVNVTVNDLEGDAMNLSFYTNATGSWGWIGSHNSTTNGSKSNSTSVFTSYNTKYWWTANLTDGEDWTNATYNFTTGSNIRPAAVTPSPSNNSVGNLKTPTFSVVANDTNNDTSLTIEWYENTTGSWVLQQTNSSLSDGDTAIWQYNNATSFNTKYYLKCVINDTLLENSSIFNFTTMNFNASYSLSQVNISNTDTITINDLSGGNATHIEWRVDGVNVSHQDQAQGGGHSAYNLDYNFNMSNNYTLGIYINNSEGDYHEWYNTSITVDRNVTFQTPSGGGAGINYIIYHLNESTNASDFSTTFGIQNYWWVHKYNTTSKDWDSWWVGMTGVNFEISQYDVVVCTIPSGFTQRVNLTEAVNLSQNQSISRGYNYLSWSNSSNITLGSINTIGFDTGDFVFKYNTSADAWYSMWVGYTGNVNATIEPYDVFICNVGGNRFINI
jgi:hypothetical protein